MKFAKIALCVGLSLIMVTAVQAGEYKYTFVNKTGQHLPYILLEFDKGRNQVISLDSRKTKTLFHAGCLESVGITDPFTQKQLTYPCAARQNIETTVEIVKEGGQVKVNIKR